MPGIKLGSLALQVDSLPAEPPGNLIKGSNKFIFTEERRKWQPTPVFLLGEFHGQRSLAGYSPWFRRESKSTEQLTLSF